MIAMRLSIGLLALALPAAAFAEHSGSLEDQMACTPDVYRLCSSKIPDEDAIVACLNANKPKLSPACAKVFSAPDPAAGGGTDSGDN